jgi:hypothetical protein
MQCVRILVVTGASGAGKTTLLRRVELQGIAGASFHYFDRRVLSALPMTGVLSGIALLGFAATWYPGGYRWSEHTISALFQPATPGGVVNPARPFAVLGVLMAMSGIAFLFHLVSSRTSSAFHKKAIQIGGFASAAFATLTVALLHDLMVGSALVCFVVALSAVLHMLYRKRELRLFALGVLFVALELGTAVLYFGQTFLEFLPIGQKAALVLIGLWLFVVQHRSGVPGNPST